MAHCTSRFRHHWGGLLIFPLRAKERKKESLFLNLNLNLNLNLYLYIGALHALRTALHSVTHGVTQRYIGRYTALHRALHSVTSGVTSALRHARRSPLAAAARRLPISLCAKEREKEILTLSLYLYLDLYLYLYLEASHMRHFSVPKSPPFQNRIPLLAPSSESFGRIQCRCFRPHPRLPLTKGTFVSVCTQGSPV